MADETGKVKDIGIKKTLSRACDEEAKQAFRHASRQGYKPLFINSKPTAYRMEVPVKFGLG